MKYFIVFLIIATALIAEHKQDIIYTFTSLDRKARIVLTSDSTYYYEAHYYNDSVNEICGEYHHSGEYDIKDSVFYFNTTNQQNLENVIYEYSESDKSKFTFIPEADDYIISKDSHRIALYNNYIIDATVHGVDAHQFYATLVFGVGKDTTRINVTRVYDFYRKVELPSNYYQSEYKYLEFYKEILIAGKKTRTGYFKYDIIGDSTNTVIHELSRICKLDYRTYSLFENTRGLLINDTIKIYRGPGQDFFDTYILLK